MSMIFFHRANDYTGSTRALATVIESEYRDINAIVVTLDKLGAGFLTNMPQVKLKKVYYPIFQGKQIKFLSYIVSISHMFLISLILGFKFDTFYVNTIVPYPAVIGGRLLRKKIIYHIHEKFIDNSFEKKIVEFVFNNVKSYRIFVSKYVFNQYLCSNNNYVIKYNKLPMSFVNEVSIVPIESRSLKNILMVSSLSKAKGIKIFVELADRIEEFNFILIVSASEVEILSFFGFSSKQNLKIISTQSNIHSFLRKSDLLLNLSIPAFCVETFGLTIIEGMIYGIPAIVPNIGGPTEIVLDGYNGYCIDVTNISILESKLRFALEKDNYRILAKNAFKQVKKFI